MKSVLDFLKSFLQGKKTYLIAVAIGIVVVVHTLGWIDDTLFKTLLELLGAGGLASLRSAVAKK